jgi:hypothetical protein
MKTLVLAAAAALTLAAGPAADARPLWLGGSCPPSVCGANGPQSVGIARPALEASRPVVSAVTLPSGETVDLR